MTEIRTPRTTLFDPATVDPPKCKACGSTRKNLCRHDADLEHGAVVGKRPRSCLNSAQNRDGVPF